MKPLKDYFSLYADQADINEIEERIRSNSSVNGSNMFILIFAILIASIGLNMDSTAVVIGAMLISPLMSIITSISYGIVKRNIIWIKITASRFFLQILISICTSAIYFYISPLNHFSNELLARTQPTLWDALIAICGGFAAIIASTRKNPFNNVIPGAAIATALMPPLCTVGYCIANGEWMPALGALYLFSINVIFICLSGVVGLRIMKISRNKEPASKQSQAFFVLLLLFALIPSGLFAIQSVKQITLEDQYKTFIQKEFQFEKAQVVKSDMDFVKKQINVALIGPIVPKEHIQTIESHLSEYGLEDFDLEVSQNHSANQSSEEEIIQELLLLYPQIQKAGFTHTYTQSNQPSFTLLLTVDQTIDEKPLLDWLHTKFEGTIEIQQIVKEENQ